MEQKHPDDNLINNEDKESIKNILPPQHYLVKKYMKLLIPQTSEKFIGHLSRIIIFMHIYIIVFIFMSIIILLPIYLADKYGNSIYDQCNKENIKPEFAPFCCDHRDPQIGMNCENFMIGVTASLVAWCIPLTLNILLIRDNKKWIISFLLLHLLGITFFLIYFSIGAVILYGSNSDCLEMQDNAIVPEGYKESFPPPEATRMFVIEFFGTLAIYIPFCFVLTFFCRWR